MTIEGAAPSVPHLTLDVTGFPCPLPVLKARKALAGLADGAVLEVISDDPAAGEDFEAFCRATGHRLRGQAARGKALHFWIEKRDSAPSAASGDPATRSGRP